MEKIYLTYGVEGPACINIDVSYGWRPDHIKFLFKSDDIIQSSKTPSEVLNELEDLIKSRIGERAPFSGGIRGTPRDKDPKYRDYSRSISWLPRGKWPMRDETPEQKEKREKEVDEYNRTLHDKLYSVYQEFVQKHPEMPPGMM